MCCCAVECPVAEGAVISQCTVVLSATEAPNCCEGLHVVDHNLVEEEKEEVQAESCFPCCFALHRSFGGVRVEVLKVSLSTPTDDDHNVVEDEGLNVVKPTFCEDVLVTVLNEEGEGPLVHVELLVLVLLTGTQHLKELQ